VTSAPVPAGRLEGRPDESWWRRAWRAVTRSAPPVPIAPRELPAAPDPAAPEARDDAAPAPSPPPVRDGSGPSAPSLRAVEEPTISDPLVPPARPTRFGSLSSRTPTRVDPAPRLTEDARHRAASAARLGAGVGGDVPDEAIVDGRHRYINRELSTLDFNRRVLAQAAAEDQPLLERLKYLAIFSSNLDEFFQVRVAGLKDQQAAGVAGTAPDGLSVTDQLTAIRAEVVELLELRHHLLFGDVLSLLGPKGISLADWDGLDDDDRAWLKDMFDERIFPVLTPLAVDPGHPFPYISNLSLNLAAIVSDPVGGERRFARLKVPPLLPGFFVLPDGKRFVALEQVIAAHLSSLFPGMEIESHHAFRVTRNVDLALEEDEADDLLAAVELELRRRRFGRAVRLEIDHTMTDEVKELLTRELDLGADDVYVVAGPLDLGGLWAVHAIDRPDLKDEPFVPVTPPELSFPDGEQADIFAAIGKDDILVHHPYDSFAMSVEAFIIQASRDPDVLTIKQTLYRTSGDSPVVQALIRAAERGKQVAALVELKARGDEAANIGWARALERAGVHVVYGLVGLKTHSKTALVVRQEGDGIRRYCHIGTGNYNSTTARLYEDLGVLTASPELGADLTDLFNYLTGYSRRVDYRKLMVAPTGLRSEMLALIHRETALGDAGRIIWKLNSLVDKEIVDALYEASTAGVSIDVIARSICCLRPGVPGLSDNIRVRGLVGRWLEHSRIFYFGAGSPPDTPEVVAARAAHYGVASLPVAVPEGGDYFIGSADMMERNLDRRVEAVVPVDGVLTGRLREILEVELADDVLSWALSGDGTWAKVKSNEGLNAHRYFQEAATARGRLRHDLEALQDLDPREPEER
jgi:polyphosphate kinase